MNGTTTTTAAADPATPTTANENIAPPNISTTPSSPNADVDDTLRQKYSMLKKRVREIEEDNDAIHHKLTKAMRQIKRLRVERIVLLEELDQSRRRDGKSKTMGTSDSEGDMSDSGMNAGLKGSSRKDKRSINNTIAVSKAKTANGKQPQERKKRDPNAPKGPGNVFFLYCRMERDNIKDQLTSDNLGEATRLLGQQWKALPKEEKQVYYDLYNKEQKEFEQAMELYNASGGSTTASATGTTNGANTGSHGDQQSLSSSLLATAAAGAEVKEETDDVDMLAEEESVREDDDEDLDDELPSSSLPVPTADSMPAAAVPISTTTVDQEEAAEAETPDVDDDATAHLPPPTQ